MSDAADDPTLARALLALRLGVFVVMLVWTLDKFVDPEHAAAVYASFYLLEGLGPALMYALGAVELAVVLGFLLGLAKRWTYGAVLVFHAVSTLASFGMYLEPFANPNRLFFAAWPMLAACLALFWLRDRDVLWTLGGRPARAPAAPGTAP